MSIEQLRRQIERIAVDLGGPDAAAAVQLERPRNPEHGDWATNVALTLAGRLRRAPRQVAVEIVERLDAGEAGIASVDIAGPGFINFRLTHSTLQSKLEAILGAGPGFGRSGAGARRRVMVEFVSANPTGPLHVAHGRGAALGDGIASLLEWTGHDVQREFYINDAGVQIDRLVDSIEIRMRQGAGEAVELPEGGYRGDYVVELAGEAEARFGLPDAAAAAAAEAGAGGAPLVGPAAERRQALRAWAIERLLSEQRADLERFRIQFDEFYPESRVYEEGRIEAALAALESRGLLYESEGARWLATTRFGDDKDRVLVKSDGSYTYFLPDIAYHLDKAERGFALAIDIWGADHHGYIPRMQAALKGLDLEGFLDVEIVQLVRVMRGGREVRLSKRAGEFVTLRDLMEEVGVDVARYFFLMRRGDAQMVFDLDLALDHSEKNPVYKVQYAHARMMSIFRKAGLAAADVDALDADLGRLEAAAEQDLIKQLDLFPEIVERAAAARSPHLVCDYLEATAGQVNSWYHAGNPSRNPELAVLVPDEALKNARLVLARGIQIVLRNGLGLLGLEAPERMEREESE